MSPLDKIGALVLAFVLALLALRCESAEPTVPDLQVDTLYQPPPGFLEAFNLRCEWLPADDTL